MTGSKLAVALLGAALTLSLTAPATAEGVATPAHSEIETAERAFAAKTAELGYKRGFLAFADPRAVSLNPRFGSMIGQLNAIPDDGRPGPDWWPRYVVAARSGDLGATVGPFPRRDGRGYNHYLTVWSRRPDGAWRWLLDRGADAQVPELDRPRGARPDYLAVGVAYRGKARQALQDIELLDARVLRASASASRLLARDALVLGLGQAPASGADAKGALSKRPVAETSTAYGAHLSAAGDLAVSFGALTWREQGQLRRGAYIHIWRRAPSGWRLLVDQLGPTDRTGA